MKMIQERIKLLFLILIVLFLYNTPDVNAQEKLVDLDAAFHPIGDVMTPPGESEIAILRGGGPPGGGGPSDGGDEEYGGDPVLTDVPVPDAFPVVVFLILAYGIRKREKLLNEAIIFE